MIPRPKGINFLSYGQALSIIEAGGKASAHRWGSEGKVYIEVKDFSKITKELPLTIVLVDTIRDKTVNFTPSVENQLEDTWYEV